MEQVHVNKQELAELFAISVPTVDSWIKAGCPVEQRGTHGKPYVFDVSKVADWRQQVEERERAAQIEREGKLQVLQLNLLPAPEVPSGGMTQKDRREAIQTALLEDRLRRERREVIPRDEVRADYEAVFQLLRQRLTSVHTVLARTAGLTVDQGVFVQREMHALLSDLRKQIADPELRPEACHAG